MSSLLYGAPSDSSSASVALGNQDPTVSFNLGDMVDWYTAMPFLDLTRMMRPWQAHEEGSWGGMSYNELAAGGYLDENGWVREIPAGHDRIGGAWDLSGAPAGALEGVYVLNYEGEGEISLNGGEVISREDGQIVFRYFGGTLLMDIVETDPNGTGDYIRDISIVREDMLPLYEAGAIFNPEWLALIEDSRELRLGKWMATDHPVQPIWEDRPQVDDAIWTTDDGVPVEVLVRLANETGTDPWFTIPHLADDDYIREFATYVRDNLDPNLKAHVEFSNEVWNYAFVQAQWADAQSIAEWGVSAPQDYYAKRATENALIWEEVFGSEADARVVNVLATFAINNWVTERILTAPVWQENDPDTYVAPSSVFDELATTIYFGASTIADAGLRAELISMINDPSVDAEAWLAEQLMDPTYSNSIPQIVDFWAETKAITDAYGVAMTAYEGGQHVHHSFAVAGLTQADIAAVNDFMAGFVRSEEMAQLYEELWDAWAAISGGPFMQFEDVGDQGVFGSWGLWSHVGDTNPRAEFIAEQMETAAPWWDEAGGVQYQQGLNYIAGDGGEQIVGTDQEDFVAGGTGDDVIRVLGGTDGVNGAGGNDRMVLSGQRGDYTVFEADGGVYLDGPDGFKFVTNVEAFTFEQGGLAATVTLTELLEGAEPAPEPEPEPTPEPEPEPTPEPEPEPTPEPEPEPTPEPGPTTDAPEADLSKNIVYVGHSLIFGLDDVMGGIISDSGGTGSVASQLIPGASLRWNWENGPGNQWALDVRPILSQGQADVLIITEAVPLENHVTWNDSSGYAAQFYNLAVGSNPEAQVFLYETWHDLRSGTGFDVPHDEGDAVSWRARLDQSLPTWEGIVADVNAQRAPGTPEMKLLPVGQAMAALYDAIQVGQAPGFSNIRDVFLDDIHYNDAGSHFVAMVQYMAIHGDVPIYNASDALTSQQFATLTDIAWTTVSSYYGFGEPAPETDPEPIMGTDDADDIDGTAGDDTIEGQGGNDTLEGGGGDDSLSGDQGSDRVYGGAGSDIVLGVDGGDSLFGESGNDRMGGGQGSDLVVGGEGNDTMRGGNGQDTLNGGDGNDLLKGGRLNDTVNGGQGDDEIHGQKGNDIVNAGQGSDTISGAHGRDSINGGAGDDLIDAGSWRDTLTGGEGEDTFILSNGYHSDVITDFTDDEDTILLDTGLWSGALTAEQVVDQFAVMRDGNVVLDFGREEFVLEGVTDDSILTDDIAFL